MESFQQAENHCLICYSRGADRAHVKTRGSGGTDESWNIMYLCRGHHTEQHKIGIVTFAKKYIAVFFWLEMNGWEIKNNKLTR